jgi:CheY-like chemotaxis protein
MRIIIVDDDTFTHGEPLAWGLRCATHEVVQCPSVHELKCGWWEVTPEGVDRMRTARVPDRVIQALEPILTSRFETEELFELELERVLSPGMTGEYESTIKRYARQDPFEPRPDCMLLDMMMPVQNIYSLRETEDGKRTGMRILGDEDLRGRMQNVPVVVVTIDRSMVLSDSLRQAFPQVRWILHKPVLATDVLPILKVIHNGVSMMR